MERIRYVRDGAPQEIAVGGDDLVFDRSLKPRIDDITGKAAREGLGPTTSSTNFTHARESHAQPAIRAQRGRDRTRRVTYVRKQVSNNSLSR